MIDIKMLIADMTIPAIARPLPDPFSCFDLDKPMIEKIIPRIVKSENKAKNKHQGAKISDNMKPAIAMPLLGFAGGAT